MKLFVAIIILLLTVDLNSQTTAIPDPNFEQELITLGLDVLLDGVVLTSNINSVNYLDVFNKNISDLSGIEDFTALEVLYCGQNPLTSLDVTQNTMLTELNCSYNQLSSLNVTQNLALNSLYCVNNQLTSLDVTQNTVLENLSCYVNQLNALDVTQNTSLISLDCHSNFLSAIDVTQNVDLEIFFCYQNQIIAIDVSQNISLIHFWCYYNQLTSLDISQNSYLDGLYCYNNQLTSLNTSQNGILTKLICSSNQITELNLSQNTALMYIACDSNRLSCLNAKNINDTNLIFFNTVSNLDLHCIEVNNTTYSAVNWTNVDAQVSFSTNCTNTCSTVGIDELSSSSINIFPNPTSGQINISLEEAKTGVLSIRNYLGQLVMKQEFKNTQEFNISLDVPSGIYFLQLEIDGELITKKVVKK